MASARRRRSPLPFLCCLGLLLVLAGVVDGPLLTFYRISGSSMMPTFSDGDRVVVLSLGALDVGDAVIARHEGEALIKRVVALPGDSVELLGGVLFRNGMMEECFVPPQFLDNSYLPVRYLQKGEYFLLGDNRTVSVDSRIFGPVTGQEIIGKVVYRWDGARSDARPVTAAEK
ncbi:MAG: signal peptidase I [Planctomycetota bacterium]